MLFFTNKTTLLSIWHSCVLIYILYLPTARVCTTSIILYKTRPCVHALYLNRAAWVQTEFTHGTYRSLYDRNHHRFRHRTHQTFGWYRPGHRQGKQSTTTHIQARSTTQGWQESLKDRIERYVQLRAIEHWTPPTHPSYNLFDARLKSFENVDT